jgi:redox-sensitive bicupin YhaK (pirin superfamily)
MSHIQYRSTPLQEGDGVEVRRLFPLPGRLMNRDPFMLWDHFRIGPGHGFPTHAHRGFEAITYLFSGTMQHRDNLGNNSTIGAGGAQRFTAGKGISHSEMPGETGETRGIQLWINLPRRLKQIEPAYQEVVAGAIPEHDIEGGTERIIAGPGSPLQLQTEVGYREVRLRVDMRYVASVPEEHTGIIYLADGEAVIDGTPYATGDACFLEPGIGWTLHSSTDCRFMVCTGLPHGEAVRQHGGYID